MVVGALISAILGGVIAIVLGQVADLGLLHILWAYPVGGMLALSVFTLICQRKLLFDAF